MNLFDRIFDSLRRRDDARREADRLNEERKQMAMRFAASRNSKLNVKVGFHPQCDELRKVSDDDK